MRNLPSSARLAMQDQNYDAPEAIRIKSVRRRLFDDEEKSGNKDNAINLMSEERKRHLEQAKERWNFDFEKEVPLPGNYEWAKVVNEGEEPKQAEKEDSKVKKQEG